MALVEDKDHPEPEDLEERCRQAIALDLRPYQRRSIAFMLDKELKEGGAAAGLWVKVPLPKNPSEWRSGGLLTLPYWLGAGGEVPACWLGQGLQRRRALAVQPCEDGVWVDGCVVAIWPPQKERCRAGREGMGRGAGERVGECWVKAPNEPWAPTPVLAIWGAHLPHSPTEQGGE